MIVSFSTFLGSVILCLFFTNNSFGYTHPIDLKDNSRIYEVDSNYFKMLNPATLKESAPESLYIKNLDASKDLWTTFSVHNPDTINREWYLISNNYSINEIDLIEVDNANNKIIRYFRDTIGIYERFIQHRQPVFPIVLKPGETKVFYLRIKNESTYYYVFTLFSHENFASHYLREYMMYSLFYGFMLFVFLYNLFHFLLMREKVILFYCLFIFFQLIYMLFRDGLGLFLIPDYPEYADLIKNVGRGSLGIFLLLYTYFYFRTDTKDRLFKLFAFIIAVRAIYTIVMLNETSAFTHHLELFTILFCTFCAYYFYKKENADAIYMTIGLSFLSINYILYYISVMVWSRLNEVGFLALYYGVASESIFMTLALAERFKRAKVDNFKKEQMNKELESMVEQRTSLIAEQNKLLEDKSDELNLFLYSASHDLKGPLKTIQGLCNIGLVDKEADPAELFNLIKRKLNNLESNISDLNSVTKIKNVNLPKILIDFNQMQSDMEERFQSLQGFKQVEILYSNTLSKPYYADLFSVKCIYQNIYENALKYRDITKKSTLSISISDSVINGITIVFADNGMGIPAKILPNIFNMFYRGNEESRDDTGLGLYIVKQAVQKLNGRINVESTEGIGTAFILQLPF
ncbi:MAG: sensor histidine kinase [Cytophagales bacterium]|nr:sensor histidine kinase [Cytophaga sp.]